MRLPLRGSNSIMRWPPWYHPSAITSLWDAGGWARLMAVIDSGLCTRVDIYGYSAGAIYQGGSSELAVVSVVELTMV